MARSGGAVGAGAGTGAAGPVTVIASRIGCWHSRLSASLIRGASLPSSTPFAYSFGTPSSAVPDDQDERLAVLEPAAVLRLDTLPLGEELFQDAWPHCGKIGG